MLLPAKLVCGLVDGKFRCKNVKDGTTGIEIDDGKKKDTPGETNGENGGKGGATNGAGGGGGGGGGGGAGGGGGGGTETDTDNTGCPEGYKVLDPPSKYGPCEPPEGHPNNAYNVCPPGATGTPPSCECPGQSDYGDRGNKCVQWRGGCGTGKAGWYFEGFCKPEEKKECKLLPDGQEKCCCKTYLN